MKQLRYKYVEIWMQTLAIVPPDGKFRRYFYEGVKTEEQKKEEYFGGMDSAWVHWIGEFGFFGCRAWKERIFGSRTGAVCSVGRAGGGEDQ